MHTFRQKIALVMSTNERKVLPEILELDLNIAVSLRICVLVAPKMLTEKQNLRIPSGRT